MFSPNLHQPLIDRPFYGFQTLYMFLSGFIICFPFIQFVLWMVIRMLVEIKNKWWLVCMLVLEIKTRHAFMHDPGIFYNNIPGNVTYSASNGYSISHPQTTALNTSFSKCYVYSHSMVRCRQYRRRQRSVLCLILNGESEWGRLPSRRAPRFEDEMLFLQAQTTCDVPCQGDPVWWIFDHMSSVVLLAYSYNRRADSVPHRYGVFAKWLIDICLSVCRDKYLYPASKNGRSI